jgi:hypothetical protein
MRDNTRQHRQHVDGYAKTKIFKKTMKNQENQKAIRYFLKEGYSNRKIDSILGYKSEETKGLKSWNILKKM